MAQGTAGALGAAGRFIGGDPLRGLACVAIVIYHDAFGVVLRTTGAADTYRFDGAFGTGAPAIRLLDVSLWLFFALSAYLLSKPFIVALADGDRRPDTWRYVRNRLLRIVPVFWVVYALTLLRHGTAGASAENVLGVFGFAQTYDPSPAGDLIGQAWTLNVEMAFYLSLPLAFGLLWWARRIPSRDARLALVVACAGAVFLASLWFRGPVADSLVHTRSFPAMLFTLMPGVVLAAVEVWVGPRFAGRRPGRWLAWGMAALAVALLAVYIPADPLLERTRSLIGVLAAGALVGALLVWQWTTGSCSRLLDNRVTNWLGERSYSIYLWHFLVGLEVARIVGDGPGPWGQLGLTLVPTLLVTVALSDLSYRYVEMPFLRMRKGWRHALGRGREPAEGPAPVPVATT